MKGQYIHTSIHPSIHPYIHLSTHPSIRTAIHPSTHPTIPPSQSVPALLPGPRGLHPTYPHVKLSALVARLDLEDVEGPGVARGGLHLEDVCGHAAARRQVHVAVQDGEGPVSAGRVLS